MSAVEVAALPRVVFKAPSATNPCVECRGLHLVNMRVHLMRIHRHAAALEVGEMHMLPPISRRAPTPADRHLLLQAAALV